MSVVTNPSSIDAPSLTAATPSLTATNTRSITVVNSQMSPIQMENIFKDVGRCEYVRNVHSGNPIIPGRSYPKSYVTCVNVKKEPFKSEDEPVKDPMSFIGEIKDGKTNPLFEAALRTVVDSSKITPYHWKEFFRMLMMFSAFSFFGREDFSLSFNETNYTIELYMQYIDPSMDGPDLEGSTGDVTVYNNRKHTSIIYNKSTGIVSKSEILDDRTNSTFVWDCRTGKKILTRTATLCQDWYTGRWEEKVVDNVFYKNGYVSAVEYIRNGLCGTDIYPIPEGHKDVETDPMVFLKKQRKNGFSKGKPSQGKPNPVKKPTSKDFPPL